MPHSLTVLNVFKDSDSNNIYSLACKSLGDYRWKKSSSQMTYALIENNPKAVNDFLIVNDNNSSYIKYNGKSKVKGAIYVEGIGGKNYTLVQNGINLPQQSLNSLTSLTFKPNDKIYLMIDALSNGNLKIQICD